MTQSLLFPDPRPIVERLGRDFFRQLPERPGVYLMRDARDTILYIGKAKNLRKRLGSYRVANPDRVPRRILRLLHAVNRIELQECPDESAALARESELLREIKPKFNRAGTWPAKPRYLVWRSFQTNLEFAITETPEDGWKIFGPKGRSILYLRLALVRILWLSLQPKRGFLGLPHGWATGQLKNPVTLPCSADIEEVTAAVELLFAAEPEAFGHWARKKAGEGLHPFDQSAVERDLEYIAEFFKSKTSKLLSA